MAHRAIEFSFPAHFVIFRYKGVPRQWHVTCLEVHAFGSGKSVEAAFAHLIKTIEAQLDEAANHGFDALFKNVGDTEWVEAYARGKHPALEDVVVAMSAEGAVRVVMTPKIRAELAGTIRVDTTAAWASRLQPA